MPSRSFLSTLGLAFVSIIVLFLFNSTQPSAPSPQQIGFDKWLFELERAAGTELDPLKNGDLKISLHLSSTDNEFPADLHISASKDPLVNERIVRLLQFVRESRLLSLPSNDKMQTKRFILKIEGGFFNYEIPLAAELIAKDVRVQNLLRLFHEFASNAVENQLVQANDNLVDKAGL